MPPTRARRYRHADDTLTAAGSVPPMPVYARWTAVVAFDNILIEEGSLGPTRSFGEFTWRDLPQALKMGHTEANTETVVGHIARYAKMDEVTYAEGVFYDTHHGRQAAMLAQSGSVNGISAEPGGTDGKLIENEDGWIEMIRFDVYEIAALAQCDIPGFDGAGFLTIDLIDDAEISGREMQAIAASADLSSLGPDYVVEPEPKQPTRDDLAMMPTMSEADLNEIGFQGLIAAGSTLDEYPDDSFMMPESPVPMPLTVFDDLSFCGHLAIYGTCHIAYKDRCVTPPRSQMHYTPAHQGQVLLKSGGLLRVARISIGSEHAPLGLRPRASVDFYERNAQCAAHGRILDGSVGIWVSGHLNMRADETLHNQFASAAWSGDWRKFRGQLELIGVLSVNIPGFPLPEAHIGFDGKDQVSLVASGAKVVASLDGREGREWASAVLGRKPVDYEDRIARLSLLDRVAASVGMPTRSERLQAAASRASITV